MADIFGAAARGLRSGRERKRQESNDELDQALKYAQLKEAGYDVQRQPSRGLFGGGGGLSLVQDPNFVSMKELQKQKLQNSLDPNYMTAYQRAKVGSGGGLTAGQRTAKDKATNEIFQEYELDKVRRGVLDKALEGSENLPQGFFGKQKIGLAKAMPFTKGLFGVSDKMIEDSQELKMALTQGTLAETAHTKGAISDSEMMLFKQASANDDFNSPAIKPVLEKIRAFVDAGEAGRFGAYQKNYGEDPRSWFGNVNTPKKSGGQIMTDAQGNRAMVYPDGTIEEL